MSSVAVCGIVMCEVLRLRVERSRQANPHVRHCKVLCQMFAIGGQHTADAFPVGDQAFQNRLRDRVQVVEIDDRFGQGNRPGPPEGNTTRKRAPGALDRESLAL